MTHHPVIRKRGAELQLELQAQIERDGQRYPITRKAIIETLMEIITSRPRKRGSTILCVKSDTLAKRGEWSQPLPTRFGAWSYSPSF